MPNTRAPLPEDEAARLETLRGYLSLCIENTNLFDEVTKLAARACSASLALLSLVDADQVRHISKFGNMSGEVDRRRSFSSWTILRTDIFVVEDASREDRFKDALTVVDKLETRFYAGMPLITSDGHAIGALSVMDHIPRSLGESEANSLRALARLIVTQLEFKRQSIELQREISDRQNLEEALEVSNKMVTRLGKRNAELANLNSKLRRQTSERQQVMDSLAESEERYSLVVKSANDGLWDWNLKTNEIHFCPRWKSILGYDEHEISEQPDEWFNRVHPEDFEQVHAEIAAHLLGLTPQFQSEHRMRDKNGNYLWVLSRGLAVWDANREVYRMAGSITDITDQKETEQQLLHNAFHDVLTGLPNRALFMYRLKRALERSRIRDDYKFAVVFLDLDRFKVVNDSLGHQCGDQLLVGIAQRLESSLRPSDTAARLGGDEFAIIIDHIKHVSDATQAAERIQKELVAPFNLSGNEVFISASIGISLNLTSETSPEELLRDADTAMYRAKERGRGRIELFNQGMHTEAVETLQFETDLRRALTRNEFQIHYQPIISLDGWRIMGFEALLRWEHPQHGFIPPLQFIPVAEETGMITEIGHWVMIESCKQLKIWQAKFPFDPPLAISVNLSGKQFSQPDLIDQIEQVLEETGVEATSLKIEITESAIIENVDSATVTINRLKALGIKVSLDDFGTGYSSLSYLHRFPIDTLKIDRSFVTRMNLPKNSEIIRTIVNLASNLGMDVIAEGVETGEQVIQLSGMNCEYVQGYLISKPIDAESVEKLIQDTSQRGFAPHAEVA